MLKFKSLKSKILFGFSIIIALVAVLVFINYISITNNNKSTGNILKEQLPLLIANQKLEANFSERLASVRGYLLTGDEQFKSDFEVYTEEVKDYQKIILELNDNENFREMTERTTEWENIIIDEIFSEYDQGNVEEALSILSDKAIPLGEELIANYQEAAANREALITESGENIIAEGEMLIKILLGLSLLILIISIVTSTLFSIMITKPIITVMERMKRIAEGDLSSEPLEMKTADETGQLTIAANSMNDDMRKLLHSIHQVSESVTSQSEELSQSSNEVMESTEQVASTMQEIAVGAETQANNATDLSSNMNTFTNNIQEASEEGGQIQKSAEEVLVLTNNGAELMKKSMEQMHRIDEVVQGAVKKVKELDAHSEQISELVSVIQDILDQTNLLALNAAIEAARAGEYGQGFAVVAEEVRKLAEQSSSSVNNITEIVNNIQSKTSLVVSSLEDGYKDVAQGTEQIETTDETFREIRSSVMDMVDNIIRVSNNLTELAKNNVQMNQSIQEIAAISEESAAGVEETSASTEQTSSAMEQVAATSEDLSKMAEELNILVNKFKL